MTRLVLVLNAGSSSLKFTLLQAETEQVLQHGLIENVEDQGAALQQALEQLGTPQLAAVGHRVVHGGEHFVESTLIDEQMLERLGECSRLAPLHNPANLAGIAAARARFPDVPQVAVFDTAFHQSLPPHAFMYALPRELYERHGVRRYGFHGTSHRYVAEVAAQQLGKPLEELQLVTAHLGNGCSCAAIKRGKSVDTSMGLTPLEGLVMGTRSGDVDPGLHAFLAEETGQTLSQITDLLNHQSGLLGLSGQSHDMRQLLEARDGGDERARLAIDVFCYRLAKQVLALGAGLSRLDALVFTGGIGENAAPIRAATLAQLQILGAELDADANRRHGRDSEGRISAASSRLVALVIPTNEELMIAREAIRLVSSTPATETPG